MSYTAIYKVPHTGSITEYKNFENSYLGAYNVWKELSKKYLHLDRVPILSDKGMQDIWDLGYSDRVTLSDRIVMLSTFDKVIVKKDNLLYLIKAMTNFVNDYEPGHFPDQIKALHEIDTENIFGICWQQTSITDCWGVYELDESDEDNEDDYRMYDVSKDSDHWFLFDKLGHKIIKE